MFAPLFPVVVWVAQETAGGSTGSGWLDILFDKPIHLVVIAGLSFAVWRLWAALKGKDKQIEAANDKAHQAHVTMLQAMNSFQLHVLEKLDEMKDYIRNGKK